MEVLASSVKLPGCDSTFTGCGMMEIGCACKNKGATDKPRRMDFRKDISV
jgi:hypothetical protein